MLVFIRIGSVYESIGFIYIVLTPAAAIKTRILCRSDKYRFHLCFRVMVMETPSPQCVGREFVRQYYTLMNEAPNFLHRWAQPHIPMSVLVFLLDSSRILKLNSPLYIQTSLGNICIYWTSGISWDIEVKLQEFLDKATSTAWIKAYQWR